MYRDVIFLLNARTGLYFAGWYTGIIEYADGKPHARWTKDYEKAQRFTQLAGMHRIRSRLGANVVCVSETRARDRAKLMGAKAR